jgi:hypothetical protein
MTGAVADGPVMTGGGRGSVLPHPDSAPSPRNTLWRYLVIQTIWRWIENVVWEPWR